MSDKESNVSSFNVCSIVIRRVLALLEIHYLTWKVGYWFRDRVRVRDSFRL